MASATKGELVQLGHDIRQRIREFCGAHGMQDADGVAVMLSSVYFLAKHTGTLGDLETLTTLAINIWSEIDAAEAAKNRPTLIVNTAQPRDVRIAR